jgi:hypothetical protein
LLCPIDRIVYANKKIWRIILGIREEYFAASSSSAVGYLKGDLTAKTKTNKMTRFVLR